MSDGEGSFVMKYSGEVAQLERRVKAEEGQGCTDGDGSDGTNAREKVKLVVGRRMRKALRDMNRWP